MLPKNAFAFIDLVKVVVKLFCHLVLICVSNFCLDVFFKIFCEDEVVPKETVVHGAARNAGLLDMLKVLFIKQ